jgi:hypothetical protein
LARAAFDPTWPRWMSLAVGARSVCRQKMLVSHVLSL